MSLPKIETLVYETELPSGIKVKYRPFLVKEEKLLLVASESDSAEEITTIVKQIIQNCLVEGPSVDELPIFDVDFLLIQLRARSVNEKVTMRYKCNALVKTADGGEKPCDVSSDYVIDLLSITPIRDPQHTSKIMLTDTIGVTMKYPGITTFQGLFTGTGDINTLFGVIVECIDTIFDKEEVHHVSNIPRAEVIEFLESLSSEQMKKIDQFFTTFPKVELVIHFDCPSCGYKEDIEVKALENFFG